MKKEALIRKAKEFMKSFEIGDIDKILDFYHENAVIQDIGIALAFNKKIITIKGKKKYKEFLLKVRPKKGTKKKKPVIKNFLVNKNTVCIEFFKNNMHFCEVLEFKKGKIMSNRGYWSGVPPKEILNKLQKLLKK